MYNINFQIINYIKKFIIEKYCPNPINANKILSNIRSTNLVFPLNIENIDNLLDNGIYCNYITEFYGPSCSGKTSVLLNLIQLSHLISYNVVKNDSSVIYIDSNNNFNVFKFLNYIPQNTVL